MNDGRYGQWMRSRVMLLIFLGCLLCIILCIVSYLDRHTDIFQEPDRSGYTVYIDGEEVDPEKIDLSLYSKRYDDENQVIYATPKGDDDFLTYGIIGYLTGRALAK